MQRFHLRTVRFVEVAGDGMSPHHPPIGKLIGFGADRPSKATSPSLPSGASSTMSTNYCALTPPREFSRCGGGDVLDRPELEEPQQGFAKEDRTWS